MSTLLRYDAACHALAEAKTVDEVTEWIDKAAAVREYGRRAKNRQLEIDAIEIRVRAKKRRGELLLALKASGQLREGKKKLSSASDSLPVYSLKELEVSANESSEEQKIAKIDGNSFERLLARCRAHAEAHPEKHSFDVLKPPPERGPINGAPAIMGSRIEPEDSLDYFPTPPWATRALVKHAFPVLGLSDRIARAWEPACGEGHIAEPLAEYTDILLATDIHDYGYGQVADFLAADLDPRMAADWIVTNPPFGRKTEEFVHRAIERARVGVAMFVRMQWLETRGRYERIFSVKPPTMIAFFSERVPLCKGEWKPEGDTATAYVWLIWLKGREPQAPFWIPPDCRSDLEHPADVTRFTSKPVMTERRVIHFVDGELVDVATGEIIGNEVPDQTVDATKMVVASSGGEAEKVAPSAASPEPAIAASHSDCAVVAGSTVSELVCSEIDIRPDVNPGAYKEPDINLEIPDFLRRQSDNSLADVPVPVASPREPLSGISGEASG